MPGLFGTRTSICDPGWCAPVNSIYLYNKSVSVMIPTNLPLLTIGKHPIF